MIVIAILIGAIALFIGLFFLLRKKKGPAILSSPNSQLPTLNQQPSTNNPQLPTNNPQPSTRNSQQNNIHHFTHRNMEFSTCYPHTFTHFSCVQVENWRPLLSAFGIHLCQRKRYAVYVLWPCLLFGGGEW